MPTPLREETLRFAGFTGKRGEKNIRRGSPVVTNNHRNYCWALDNRKKVKILIYTER